MEDLNKITDELYIITFFFFLECSSPRSVKDHSMTAHRYLLNLWFEENSSGSLIETSTSTTFHSLPLFFFSSIDISTKNPFICLLVVSSPECQLYGGQRLICQYCWFFCPHSLWQSLAYNSNQWISVE